MFSVEESVTDFFLSFMQRAFGGKTEGVGTSRRDFKEVIVLPSYPKVCLY